MASSRIGGTIPEYLYLRVGGSAVASSRTGGITPEYL